MTEASVPIPPSGVLVPRVPDLGYSHTPAAGELQGTAAEIKARANKSLRRKAWEEPAEMDLITSSSGLGVL